MYQNKTRVRYSELGADGKMTMNGVLDCFQDSCIFNAEDMHVGTEFQKEHGIVWILLTWQIEVRRYPQLGEQIVIGTHPYAFRSSFGYRNFIMETPDGERLACGDSLWMLVKQDLTSAAPIPPEMIAAYQIEEKVKMAYDHKKLVVIEKHHLDTNYHVNNGQYVRMMSLYLPRDAKVSDLKVEYRNQAVLGDTIIPYVGKTQNQLIVSLQSKDAIPYAVGRFTLTNETIEEKAEVSND